MDRNKKSAVLSTAGSGLQVIQISFPFDFDALTKIKSLPNRRFHDDRSGKYWTAPLHADTIVLLKKWGFEIDDALEQHLQKQNQNSRSNKLPQNIKIKGLKGELFPFQQKGLEFLEMRGGRALIADEMGLGKTIQALAYLQLHLELRPAIIICPASLKLNWLREANKWMTNPNCVLLEGRTAYRPSGKIPIINYDILPFWVDALKAIQPKVIITDECHYYKSNTANRTKAVKRLAKSVNHFIALSGTPIINRPVEIYNAVHIIDPAVMPSFWTYAKRYCGARHNGFGWDFTGATHQQELHEKLIKSVMIRRLKKDVLLDLPDKIYSFVPMELGNMKEYHLAENHFIQYIRTTKGEKAAIKAKGAETLVQIETLKQLAVNGKIQGVIDWIENFLSVSDKLVIFAVHKSTISTLMDQFGSIAVKIDGSVSMPERQKAVDAFQTNDKIKLFIGNIQAAGVGITLTASSNVAFIELPWTPGAVSQAEDRCHRIGQKDNVTVYYLLAADTIEEKIAHLLDSKKKVLNRVLDGIDTPDESLLSELINSYL